MTHPTDDHLRQRTQNETRWCGRCYRESVACICATRPNALAAAPQPAKKQTMCDRCDGSGYAWAVGNCPKCEGSGWVSSAPQPAPAGADERDEMIAVMQRASSEWVMSEDDIHGYESRIADALLAAGYRKAALAAAPQPAAEDQEARAIAEAAQITMTYRNWRGEVAQRTIRPFALWFGKTDWHPEPGWLLSAWDCDKGGRRDFALADCQFAALARPSQAGDGRVSRLVEAVETLIDAAGTAETTLAHALMDGMIDPNVEDRFETWLQELIAAAHNVRAALAAAPQPAPAPAADERDAMVEVILDAMIAVISDADRDVSENSAHHIADALIAAGYRKADAHAAKQETGK